MPSQVCSYTRFPVIILRGWLKCWSGLQELPEREAVHYRTHARRIRRAQRTLLAGASTGAYELTTGMIAADLVSALHKMTI